MCRETQPTNQHIDQRARNLIIKNKALHLRNNDRVYISRKESRRGYVKTDDCIDIWIQRIVGKRLKKSRDRLVTAINNSIGVISADKKSMKTRKNGK